MYFLLKSEEETIDVKSNYYKKRIFCPFCFRTQLKKLDSNEFYSKYHCWNKNCPEREIQFAVINDYVQNEDLLNDICDTCQEPMQRNLKVDENKKIILIFRCNSKICESNFDPYCFNLTDHKWEGKTPKVILYEDMEGVSKAESKVKMEILKKVEAEKEYEIEALSNVVLVEKTYYSLYKIEDILLLTMDSSEYSKFLEHHQDKLVVLVDIPNFIRTLRGIFPRNFEDVLKQAHKLLLDYIENSFHTSSDYIIRYFSKPDQDLEYSNNTLILFRPLLTIILLFICNKL
ncbi:MAG: hypothetical protein ACFFDF_18900 [Candidatus Odinarchaeota archaeon]